MTSATLRCSDALLCLTIILPLAIIVLATQRVLPEAVWAVFGTFSDNVVNGQISGDSATWVTVPSCEPSHVEHALSDSLLDRGRQRTRRLSAFLEQ